MEIQVLFFSWFRDLAGCEVETMHLPDGTTLGQLHEAVLERHPKLAPARRSTLMAVGLDYQDPAHVLQGGDQVSFFPPVQGG